MGLVLRLPAAVYVRIRAAGDVLFVFPSPNKEGESTTTPPAYTTWCLSPLGPLARGGCSFGSGGSVVCVGARGVVWGEICPVLFAPAAVVRALITDAGYTLSLFYWRLSGLCSRLETSACTEACHSRLLLR